VLLVRFDKDKVQIQELISRISAHNSTALYAAWLRGSKENLPRRKRQVNPVLTQLLPDRRKCLVLFGESISERCEGVHQ